MWLFWKAFCAIRPVFFHQHFARYTVTSNPIELLLFNLLDNHMIEKWWNAVVWKEFQERERHSVQCVLTSCCMQYELLLTRNLLLLLLLIWHSTSSMDFSQSALFFDLPFQFAFLNLLIYVYTHFHHLFFCHPISRLSWGFLLILDLIILFYYPLY
jgi:hypothetical protein